MIDIQNWPLNIDFTIAVQNPQLCFADLDLRQAITTKNSRGRVLLWSGNFATVYKLTNKLSTGDRAWAVRCFTRTPQSDVQHRYKLISEYLNQHQTSYLVNFEFLSQGILVKGEWYPILKMDWVEGVEIDRYIGEYIDDSQVLLRLDRQLKRLQRDLQQIGIAHGDLQHGNIMIDDEGEIKLVDYDGMYVPALQGNPPAEIGHPNYQSPMRSAKDFSDRLDDFSFAVISLSLRALAIEPKLWETFHEDNKNLIFRQNDFQEPNLSPVFQAIAQIPDDEIRDLSDRLIDRCHGKDRIVLEEQKSKFVVPLHNSFLLLGIFLLALLAMGSLLLLFKKSQPVIKTLEVSITSSPTPISSTSPVALSTPKLTPITAVSLLARYAEGQRDFRYIQLTGTQGDRLQGQDLRNINLSGSVLERVDLRQVIFKNANLNGIKLVKVDLRGADLSNSSLIDANLAFSNLSEANLSQANLLRANLSQAKLGSVILQKAELMKSNLSEADLSLANLNGANLVLANLRKANLVKANLRDSNLAAANLSEAILEGADLSAADMRSAELHLTNLSNANLSSTNLTAAKLILIEFAGTNLNGANFRNAIVENIGSIESADFSNVSNLSPNVRKYFCSLASGNIPDSGNSTKSTLNCGL